MSRVAQRSKAALLRHGTPAPHVGPALSRKPRRRVRVEVRRPTTSKQSRVQTEGRSQRAAPVSWDQAQSTGSRTRKAARTLSGLKVRRTQTCSLTSASAMPPRVSHVMRKRWASFPRRSPALGPTSALASPADSRSPETNKPGKRSLRPKSTRTSSIETLAPSSKKWLAAPTFRTQIGNWRKVSRAATSTSRRKPLNGLSGTSWTVSGGTPRKPADPASQADRAASARNPSSTPFQVGRPS